jgi:hypothetical protein
MIVVITLLTFGFPLRTIEKALFNWTNLVVI